MCVCVSAAPCVYTTTISKLAPVTNLSCTVIFAVQLTCTVTLCMYSVADRHAVVARSIMCLLFLVLPGLIGSTNVVGGVYLVLVVVCFTTIFYASDGLLM